MTTHLISLEKVSSKEVVCMFSSLPCKRITVDNSIVLTFCSVSIPFLQNNSTVLLFVFCAFYGAVKKAIGTRSTLVIAILGLKWCLIVHYPNCAVMNLHRIFLLTSQPFLELLHNT